MRTDDGPARRVPGASWPARLVAAQVQRVSGCRADRRKVSVSAGIAARRARWCWVSVLNAGAVFQIGRPSLASWTALLARMQAAACPEDDHGARTSPITAANPAAPVLPCGISRTSCGPPRRVGRMGAGGCGAPRGLLCHAVPSGAHDEADSDSDARFRGRQAADGRPDRSRLHQRHGVSGPEVALGDVSCQYRCRDSPQHPGRGANMAPRACFLRGAPGAECPR